MPKTADLPTPALLLHEPALSQNIQAMQAKADQLGLHLRPHIKTHKMPALAQRQWDTGATGVAVATLHEAMMMREAGFADIQVANEVIQPAAVQQFRNLSEQGRLRCAVDSLAGLERLNEAFQRSRYPAEVLLDIDTGLRRAGLSSQEDALTLARAIRKHPNVKLTGLMTHGGHSYGSADPATLRGYAQAEQNQLEATAQALQQAGFPLDTVSIGATPLLPYLQPSAIINELRPGNYVVYDRSQVALGTATPDQCALSVLSTVISVPAAGRAVLDAGSKALTTDQGAHGADLLSGFGEIPQKGVSVQRVSEEHGVVAYDPEQASMTVGETVQIRPNHACPVINLFDHAYLIKREQVIDVYAIAARGHGPKKQPGPASARSTPDRAYQGSG